MKLIDGRFVTSAADARAIPVNGIPHVALVGRSNVGKSTLINALTRLTLARTSAAPGKTRLANLYLLNVDGGPGGPGRWSVHLTDLPGYGYARGGRDSVVALAAIAEAYFARGLEPDAYTIAGVLHLVDARHPGLEADAEAAAWLSGLRVARTVLATKVDKLSRGERNRNVKELERQLGMTALPISAASGEGLDELWRLIARLARP